MIRLGLRLGLAGGREAVIRFVVIASAVGLGVGMLLSILAGVNAVSSQNARYAWLDTGKTPGQEQSADADATAPAADPLWWLLRYDYFDEQAIHRVDVAATGPESPVPPGIAQLPGPGEYYASPALSRLLASTQAAQLADRYPGREIGTIGPAALPNPNSLVVIIGRPSAELAPLSSAEQVSRIETTPPAGRATILNVIFAVVAAGLLFPVLVFIGTATRLTAARREQRFAAMRLVGATPRQVAVVSAVESTTAATAGTAAGFAVYLALRGPLSKIPFSGEPFFPTDLSLGLADILLVALAVPAAAAVVARLALRGVRISPLGVTRRVTPPAPRAFRLIPLLAGLGALAYFIGRRPGSTDGQVTAYFSGVLLIMVGLVIAGPWLTMVGSRVLARRSSRPASLIAARRLADNPHAGFRAISGLVLALFVTSVATSVITTIVANRGLHANGGEARTTLFKRFDLEDMSSSADAVDADLRAIPGVESVTVDRSFPSMTVRTDGSTSAIERARTALEVADPGSRWPPFTDADFELEFTQTLIGWQQLANVVILASLPIAGCSLAVSVVGGLSERKRPFSLLRLSGVQLSTLRRVVVWESAVPLLVAAAAAIGTGLLTAQLFLKAQMDYPLHLPGAQHYLIVAAGLAASLAIIAATLPLLERATGPETARNG